MGSPLRWCVIVYGGANIYLGWANTQVRPYGGARTHVFPNATEMVGYDNLSWQIMSGICLRIYLFSIFALGFGGEIPIPQTKHLLLFRVEPKCVGNIIGIKSLGNNRDEGVLG